MHNKVKRESQKPYGLQTSNFDVLLTVHLSIILVINQLDAQNLVLRVLFALVRTQVG